jgi:predicted aminopeptidase
VIVRKVYGIGVGDAGLQCVIQTGNRSGCRAAVTPSSELITDCEIVFIIDDLGGGWQEAKTLSRREKIEDVIADSGTSDVLRERLRLVMAARRYAVDSLGLAAGESFTTFAQLDRDTLVLLLSAAYRDRLQAYRWWFPIVGRLPYKGYFRPADAFRARDDFQARGFDTYLRPASAFSTLGWFNDPLLSTTVRGDTTVLVNTVIHDLSHNTLFVAGNAEFSESFASFIGSRGAEAFFPVARVTRCGAGGGRRLGQRPGAGPILGAYREGAGFRIRLVA